MEGVICCLIVGAAPTLPVPVVCVVVFSIEIEILDFVSRLTSQDIPPAAGTDQIQIKVTTTKFKSLKTVSSRFASHIAYPAYHALGT